MDEQIRESREVRQHAMTMKRRRALGVLSQRIRRRLPKGLRLHKARGQRQTAVFGNYWLEDVLQIMPIVRHVDLVSLARRLQIYMLDLDVD